MSNVVVSGNHYLGRGETYFDRFDNAGAATGERFMGNVEGFQVTVTPETVKKYSGVSGGLVAEATIRTTAEIQAICDEFVKENLALFLRAAESTFSQSSGSYAVGAPDVIIAKLDRWIPLAKRSISALVVKNSAQAITYVLGTDYEVDLALGRVYFKAGGAIAADATIKCEYAYAVVAQAQAAIGQTPLIKGKLRFKGTNTQGPVYNAEFWLVQIGGDGSLDLIGEDFGKFTLKATVLEDNTNHPTSPLGVMQQIA